MAWLFLCLESDLTGMRRSHETGWGRVVVPLTPENAPARLLGPNFDGDALAAGLAWSRMGSIQKTEFKAR